MSQFLMKPTLHQLDSVKEFVDAFAIGEGDLLFTNRHFYDDYFKALDLKCDVIHPKDYGQGEPTDELVGAAAPLTWQNSLFLTSLAQSSTFLTAPVLQRRSANWCSYLPPAVPVVKSPASLPSPL